MESSQIYDSVQKRYGAAADIGGTAFGHSVAKSFGYSDEELSSIPRDANLGLSCGNPLALAKLKEGEVVVDLGSGAGFDVFLAAQKVGSAGEAIGVDMNKEMLRRARENKYKSGLDNVSFIEGLITRIPLSDAIADCIISNCVINLVPKIEKQLVFNEMFRLLKPGGRVAISDILTRQELAPELQNNMALYVGCIAGASQVGDYEQYLKKAGFSDFLIVDAKADLNIYLTAPAEGPGSGCCGTEAEEKCCEKQPSCCNQTKPHLQSVPGSSSLNLNELAGSFKIFAVKP